MRSYCLVLPRTFASTITPAEPRMCPASRKLAFTPGSGSKVEAISGSTGTSETPPTTAGSSDTGSHEIKPGMGAQPTDKPYPTEKALSATPGPDKQGDTAGPAVPPKKD